MSRLFILIILFGGAYEGYKYYKKVNLQPLYEGAYVAVYGRNTCGYTTRLIKQLKAEDIPFEYFIVDDKDVANNLHGRMNEYGLSTARYNLPVVDVSGDLFIRPKIQQVLSQF